MRASLEEILQKEKIMVIDGSMSTALEALGANLNNTLWTASVLRDQPELVRQVHYDYLKAGADCGITCSYQATIPGLLKAGCSKEEAEELITRSVTLFKEARDQWWNEEGKDSGRPYPLCLAGIGPYGAYLADGSEYTGKYSMDHDFLWDFHYRRMELLHNAGADILLIETQPALKEALIAAEIAESLNADYWISFSCLNGTHTCARDSVRECAEVLSKDHPHLKMIGINCTKPEYIVSLIGELKKGTDLPVGVYPNSGEKYDPLTKTWTHAEGQMDFGAYAFSYMTAGADAAGGCCTTTCTHIEQVAEARKKYLLSGSPKRIH
ncbi:MAG: homocysteine S-methyltransferase [Erysipelotrichaceae bacterium]|nr:homocysteine S-methyltransferase [Erysipelotrichaceae bacterium]